MKKSRPLALLASGSISRTGIARLHSVRSRLGPVKAPSFRVARRLVNSFRAGRAARSFEELQECLELIIDVPESELPALVRQLAEQPWDWKKRTVLLWSEQEDSSALTELRELGCETGSCSPVPGFEKRVAAEGTRAALRAIKRLFATEGWYVMSVGEGKKPMYQAGLAFTEVFPIALVHAAVESFVSAGLSYVEAVDTATAQLQRAARAYTSTGRRAWNELPESITPQEAMLARERPALAEFYRACVIHGNTVFQRKREQSDQAG